MTMKYEDVRDEVEASISRFAAALLLPGHAAAYAVMIAPALWDAFPPSGKLRNPEVFAEVASFHAMKAAGVPIDQHRFRAASPVGDMAVNRRRWLLDYQRHIPPALRVTHRDPGPDTWFSRMTPGPLVDEARAISVAEGAWLASMRPRIRAGACVAVARKRLGNKFDGSQNATETLAPAGISLATAYNAAVRARLIFRRRDSTNSEGAATVT